MTYETRAGRAVGGCCARSAEAAEVEGNENENESEKAKKEK